MFCACVFNHVLQYHALLYSVHCASKYMTLQCMTEDKSVSIKK